MRFPVPAVAGILALLAGASVPSTAQPGPTSLTSASCPERGAPAYAGAAASLALNSRGRAAPVWSAEVGAPSVTVGGTAFEAGSCLVALDVGSGRVDWTAVPTQRAFAVVADGSTVLAATGGPIGGAGGANSPLIDDLVAYDPGTGVERWEVHLPPDGQQMPAALAGGLVVVSEADGAVLGLSEQDGHRLWSDPPPAGCGTGYMEDLQPDARVIGSGPAGGSNATAAIAYGCPGGGSVAEVDAASGRLVWAWRVPEGWAVNQQQAVAVSTGAAEGAVVAAPIGLVPSSGAPAVTAPAPGPSRITTVGDADESGNQDVVVLDAATGRPRWDLEGVGQQMNVVAGAGSLCVVTDAGVDCRAGVDGAPRWSAHWPGRNATSEYPPLECVDFGAFNPPCVVSVGGRMDVVTATDAAPAYNSWTSAPAPSGSFVLTQLEMATGATVTRLPLPEFINPRTDDAVSLSSPPGVLLAADGMVLVSPQYDETGVVEAYALPASG